jgi:hypothetical protein
MKTEELIRVLAADASRPVVPIGHALFRALGLGAALSGTLFLLILHPRPDIAQAIFSLPFVLKLSFALSLAVAAALFLTETARPVPPHRWRWPLMLAPILLLAGAIIVELATVPVYAWTTRLIGHNARHCVSLIPLLSLPALACLLATLRHGAPRRPMLAGATAGLVSGGVGALLYGLTCPDDSPLFIATWYSIAIAIVTGAAAHLGSRLLRW